ncbi:MAG: hypothetical protein U1E42_03350 [Rhodospirillales bacterium]
MSVNNPELLISNLLFSITIGSAFFQDPVTEKPWLSFPPPDLLKPKPETRVTPAACLVIEFWPVNVILVAAVPAPFRVMALANFKPDQLQLPAGTVTVSPLLARSMAACTSDCEQLEAVTVAASAT